MELFVDKKRFTLQVGGRNYLKNSADFTENWNLSGGTISNEKFLSGVVCDLNNNGSNQHCLNQNFQLTTSTNVTWSIYAKADNDGDKLHTELWGESGVTDQPLTTSWTRYIFQGVVIPTSRAVYFWGLQGNKGKIHVALPQLEVGDVATDWTPAIEDLQNQNGGVKQPPRPVVTVLYTTSLKKVA